MVNMADEEVIQMGNTGNSSMSVSISINNAFDASGLNCSLATFNEHF